MDFEEEKMDTETLLEKREQEVYVELGKVGFDKPEVRKQLINEAKTFADIRNSTASTENARLSNNARLDVDEQKILVDKEKVKVEKQRIAVDIGKIVAGVLGGLGMTMLGYNMDTLFPKDNRVQKFAEKFHEMLTMRK